MIENSYPFEGPKTREVFPNRLNPILIDGKVHITIEPEVFPSYYKEEQPLTDFLLDRIFDYHNALNIAETQIEDMLTPYPFIPEDFNFHRDALPTESAETLRNATFFYNDRGYILTRTSDTEWFISSQETPPTKLTLTNAKDAYTVLKSLSIITDDEFKPITQAIE